MKIKNKPVLAELGLLLITIIWGSAFVVVKNATAAVPVSYMIAIRFGLAAVLMLVFFFPQIRRINLASVKAGTALAALMYVSYYLQTVGVKFTTAGNNAFLTSVYVVIVPFLYWAVKNKKPDWYNILSAFICIVGIGVLSLNAGFHMNIGDLLSLLCGATFAAQIVGVSILTEKIDPILLTFTQFAFTAMIAFGVAACSEQFPAALSSDMVWSLLYIGIFSTLIALLLQNVCQKYVPPAKASLIMSLESLFGTLFGILLLNEKLMLKTFLGFVLIFAAVIISETKLSFLKHGKLESSENEQA